MPPTGRVLPASAIDTTPACRKAGNDWPQPSCSQSGESYASQEIAYSEPQMESFDGTPVEAKTASNSVIEKKVIKTSELVIEVSDFEEALLKIKSYAKNNKAYISDENQYNQTYQISSSLIIRVPKEKFDLLLDSISLIAKAVNSKSIHMQDVTAEFIDIESRLKNKKEVELQYRELLKKAGSISEILEVNEHLRIVREEIEAKEGRLKYLSSQVNYSTINLTVSQNLEQTYTGFFGKIGKALAGGWKGLLNFIVGLVYLWPFLIILTIIIWFVRKKIISRKKNI